MTGEDVLRMLDQEIARRHRGPNRDGVDHRNQYNLGGTEALEGFRKNLAGAIQAELPGRVQLGLDVDVPVAIRLPAGQGTAYQDPLS